MREMKFRGKRVDNGEEVKGYYCQIEDKHYIIPKKARVVEVDYSFVLGIIHFAEVIPETVGQFTNELDINEKEIYSGDTIETYDPIKLERGEQSDYTGVVSWSERSLAWVLNDKEGKFIEMLCRIEQPKIIGSIHDNPKLLEDKP